jgi:hypothetical protein
LLLRFYSVVNAIEQREHGVAGGPVTSAMWSHNCRWYQLAESIDDFDDVRESLVLGQGWTRRWTAAWRYAEAEVRSPVRDLASLPTVGCTLVRRFSWHRGQWHRSGLQFLVSTGRHHGYESLEEARLLLALDFAAGLVDVLSQPFRLRFATGDGWYEHVPDFLAYTRTGRWLIDVRPAVRIGAEDRVKFAAAAEVASLLGWRYAVVTGWKPHVMSTVDTLSAQRRPLNNRLGLVDVLLTGVARAPRPFADLAADTVAPAVARAYVLHLLWHHRLGIDLGRPLGDRTLVYAGEDGGQG